MESSEIGKLLETLRPALAEASTEVATGDLRSKASSISRMYRSLDKIQAQEHKQHIMQAASDLWNKSLSETQGEEDRSHKMHRGSLKHAALELWSAALEGIALPLSQQVQLLECGYQTAELWADINCWEEADAAMSLITSLAADPATAAVDPHTPNPGTEENIKQRCAQAHCLSEVVRLRILLHLGQELPAGALLVRLKALSTNASLPLGSRVRYVANFMKTAAREAKVLLSGGNKKPALAAQLLQAAHEAHGALLQSPEAMQVAQDAGIKADVVKLGYVVLLMLATGHLRTGNASEKALQCVTEYHRMGGGPASLEMATFLITHEALLQAGRVSEAETELLRIVTHEGAQIEISAQAIKTSLLAPGGAAGARAALAAVLEHVQSEEGAFALDLASAVLETDGDKKTAIRVSPEAEDVILELFADDRVRESLLSDPELYSEAHAVLYNYAVGLSETSCNQQAVKMYAAAVGMLPENEKEKLSEGHLSQAISYISLEDFPAAAKRLEAAESCTPGRLATAFLSFKCAIIAKDETEATLALYRLAEASRDAPDVLRLACCEALDSDADGVAMNALTLLLEKASNNEADFKASIPPGYESVIVQNLVALLVRSMSKDANKEANGDATHTAQQGDDSGDGNKNSDSRLADLACCLDRAVTRMHDVGVDTYFMNADGRYSQLRWMAQTAWTAGTQAAEAGKLQAAAVLFGCAADLYAGIPSSGRPDTLRMCHSAYIMAATSVLEEHDANPDYTPSLNLTEKRLREARAVEEAATGEDCNSQSALDPKMLVFSRILEFDLAIRRHDPEAAKAAVVSAQSLPAARAEHFIKMAGMCLDGPYKCEASARIALHAALQSLTSQPTLNYAQVAATTRSLAELAPTDADRLRVLQDASGILAAAPLNSYPSLEARWLVTCAWNRGATHAKFGRAEEADQFMGLALKMVSHVAGMDAEKEKMQDAYQVTTARLAGMARHDKPTSEAQKLDSMEAESS